MKYPFYLEQKYVIATERVVARLLTDKEAKALGYKDGYVDVEHTHTTYVDGFNSAETARAFTEDLIDCTLVNPPPKKKKAKHKRER